MYDTQIRPKTGVEFLFLVAFGISFLIINRRNNDQDRYIGTKMYALLDPDSTSPPELRTTIIVLVVYIVVKLATSSFAHHSALVQQVNSTLFILSELGRYLIRADMFPEWVAKVVDFDKVGNLFKTLVFPQHIIDALFTGAFVGLLFACVHAYLAQKVYSNFKLYQAFTNKHIAPYLFICTLFSECVVAALISLIFYGFKFAVDNDCKLSWFVPPLQNPDCVACSIIVTLVVSSAAAAASYLQIGNQRGLTVSSLNRALHWQGLATIIALVAVLLSF
jgi:hypothetical protein